MTRDVVKTRLAIHVQASICYDKRHGEDKLAIHVQAIVLQRNP
jgi:hypothetical protein